MARGREKDPLTTDILNLLSTCPELRHRERRPANGEQKDTACKTDLVVHFPLKDRRIKRTEKLFPKGPDLKAMLGGFQCTKDPRSVSFRLHGKLVVIHPREICVNAPNDQSEHVCRTIHRLARQATPGHSVSKTPWSFAWRRSLHPDFSVPA